MSDNTNDLETFWRQTVIINFYCFIPLIFFMKWNLDIWKWCIIALD